MKSARGCRFRPVVSRRVPLKRAGREWKGLSPFNKEKTPVLHRQRPEGLLSLLLLRQARRHFRLRHGDRGPELPRSGGEARRRCRPPAAEAGPAIRARGERALGPVRCARGGGAYFEDGDRHARWPRGAATTPSGAGSPLQTHERVPHRLRTEREGRAQSCTASNADSARRSSSTPASSSSPTTAAPPYDRFRHRLTIPILDAKSAASSPSAPARSIRAEPKYLNSPETKLFDKGSTVFNFARARQAGLRQGRADRGRRLYGRDRAPSGGLRIMPWRRSAPPSPSGRWISFGCSRPSPSSASTATGQARLPPRAPSTACCPILREGHSFRFAFLPEGSDPDDLVRNEGAARSRRCLADARPLIDILWQRECAAAQSRHARAPRGARRAA